MCPTDTKMRFAIFVLINFVHLTNSIKGRKGEPPDLDDADDWRKFWIHKYGNIPNNWPKMWNERECPASCVGPDNCNTHCLTLDYRYQATTLEQMILNFVDMKSGLSKPQKWVPDDAQNANGVCRSNVCKGCMQIVIDNLEQDLPSGAEYRTVTQSLNTAKQTYGLVKNDYRSYCTYLNSTQSPSPVATVSNYDMGKIVKSVLGPQCSSTNTTSGDQTPLPNGRGKRQTTNIGTLSSLSCNYKRGNFLNDGTNNVGLCNLCTAVRTLPSQYFPRFINEISCDKSDSKCLSGYGTCRERYRNIEVLLNYGTDSAPQYAQYSLSSPVGCECQVQAGSALQNLVSG